MKVLYFDTETTGLNPFVNEIFQFAAIVEIDGEVKEEVNLKCRPLNTGAIEQSALDVTGMTLEKLNAFPPPHLMVGEIQALFDRHIDKYDKTDKFYPCGHNVVFDLNFLNNLFMKNGQKYGTGSYQNWRALDTRVMANLACFDGKLDVENVKLETLCKHFGIEIQAHDALSDIRATRELFFKLRGLK